jgi:hypothetical protein
MKIRIVSKFIAVGLVILAVGTTGSFAGPVEQILNDTRSAPFYSRTEDRESLTLPSESPVSLMVSISKAHNANGGSTINAVRGDLSATSNVAVSIFLT